MKSIYPNLDEALRSRNMTKLQLADAIGISKHSIYRRFRGAAEWKLDEMITVCTFLETKNAAELFLRLDSIT